MSGNEQHNSQDTMDVAGVRCHVYETTALEAWFMMNRLRQVLCADCPPARRGTLAVVVSRPIQPGEMNFILEMSQTGGCPPLDQFMEIQGLVGVIDFHLEKTTDLPGWDGASVPVVLSNPCWFRDGKLVPAQKPMVVPDSRFRRPRRSERKRND